MFNQILLLLSDDISLNPIPTIKQGFPVFWKPLENKGPHFFHLNINSILLKLDELKMITSNTKATVIEITESKIDHSVTNTEY